MHSFLNKIKDIYYNNKKAVKYSLIAVFSIVLFIFLGWLSNHYVLWSYISLPSSFNNKLSTQIDTPSPTIEPTFSAKPTTVPTPTQALALDATPIITPEPTNTPHPGVRDNKFTDGTVIIDDTSYRDENISISIQTIERDNITYYVSEVYIKDMDYIYSAFAKGDGAYGKSVAYTKDMVNDNLGLFGISGDYYSHQNWGIVIRNGILYRDEPKEGYDIMVLFDDGRMKTYHYNEITADELLKAGAIHSYSFGPALLEDAKAIENFAEITRLSIRHPRSGVGYIEPYHYIFIVVDGRKAGYSVGMTLDELAAEFEKYNCEYAYNLDGGGSATMIFMGELYNLPQGRKSQRALSDAIIIGPNILDPAIFED